MIKQKILIIEDETVIALNIQNMLEMKGYEVCDIGVSADEAIEMTEKNNPDLILMDILLDGEKDGIDAVLEIKKNYDIPFIYCTANTNEQTLQRAKETEPHGYIIKPISREELLSKVEIVLHKHEMEKVIKRTNRALKVLSKSNHAVIKSENELELLNEICRIIVKDGGYRLSWIAFGNNDEIKSVKPVSQFGYEEGYLKKLGITWDDSERGMGPVGTAIRTGKPAVSKDILKDSNFAPWREDATKRNYASCIALPLNSTNEIIGSLNIYAEEPDAFDSDELKLLVDLADNLVYGITSLRGRAFQKQAEEEIKRMNIMLYSKNQELRATTEKLEAVNEKLTGTNEELETANEELIAVQEDLVKSELRYRDIFISSPIGIFQSTPEGKLLDVNPELAHMLGFNSPEDMKSIVNETTIAESLYFNPDERHSIANRVQLANGWQVYESRQRHRDGRAIIGRMTIRSIKHIDGTTNYLEGYIEDITERKKIEEQIKTSLKEKETLLQEIHHRTKNNMNIITSLLSLQSSQSNSNEVKSEFQKMENRIISMSKVHEMLYKSENLTNFDFGNHLQSLLEKTFISYTKQAGNIRFTINADNIKLEMDKAISCSLIINELFSNALKHAFPDNRNGEIKIHFKKGKDDIYSLIVSDNGTGLPDDFNIKKFNSLGIVLVDALVEKLNGEMKITVKKGTKFAITFPGE